MNIQDHKWHMPAAYLKVFLQFASAEQLPPTTLLKGTGLSLDNLLQSDQAVSLGATRRVLENVTRLLGPGWHLSLGPRLTVATHGPLGFAVVTAPDLKAAVDILLRFFGIRGPFLWSTGAVEGDEFVIRFYETTYMGEQRQSLIELAILSTQGMLERPLGREMNEATVSFAYAAPEYREQLEQALHAGIVFNARRHSLRFPAQWLAEPCVLHDEAMHRYLVSRCEDEMRTAAGSLPAAIAVRQALLARPGYIPSLAEVAAGQHVSSRTLIRRLNRGNTSYQSILEDVRKTLATDCLLHSPMSISRIAYRLGYRDPSNFGRAFRGWFGTSPGRYRDRES